MVDGDGDAEKLLRTLALRHSFIFSHSFEHDGYVHKEARDALIERIRHDAVVRSTVKPMLKRAWQWSAARLDERNDWTWEERLDSERWQQDALDYLYHRLWHDLDSGFDELPAFFVAGLAYDSAFAGNTLSLVQEIDTGDSRKRRKALAEWTSLLVRPWSSHKDQDAADTLKKRWKGLPYPCKEDKELQAIFRWLEATIDLEQNDDNAEQAGHRLIALLPNVNDEWGLLRGNVGDSLYQAGRKPLRPHGRSIALETPAAAPLFDAALSCKPWDDNAVFWLRHGIPQFGGFTN